jgi:NAD(P)-dependent dehydrogenase (short-subunit alcohol dehydrogenase family)
VGRGIVRRFADAEVPLIFTYQGNQERAAALESELRASGARVWSVRMDMRDGDSIRSALSFAIAKAGPIHSVLCAGGPEVPFKRMADFTPDEVENFMRGDALSFHRLFYEVIPMFRSNGGGSLTLCSTMAQRRVIDYDGISPFSKAALEAMVRQVAAEEAKHGVRCNAVAIGWVTDESLADLLKLIPPAPSGDPSTPEAMTSDLFHRIAGMMRIKRAAAPAEAGSLFAFLASQQAAYITGQVVALDGGASL